MSDFNLNAYLHDDGNLRPDCLQQLRAMQDKGIWGFMMRRMRPIRCADGLEFSAQASEAHYCTPRRDLGPWTMVEIGFPSQKVEEFMPYAEDSTRPTQTVYGWVPVEVVEKVVNDHGGCVQSPPVLVREDG